MKTQEENSHTCGSCYPEQHNDKAEPEEETLQGIKNPVAPTRELSEINTE